jgi:hypothetical protein
VEDLSARKAAVLPRDGTVLYVHATQHDRTEITACGSPRASDPREHTAEPGGASALAGIKSHYRR